MKTLEFGHARFVSKTRIPNYYPAGQRKFDFLRVQDLKNLPEPAWLVNGMFRAESQVFLYGPSGHFKSFVAIEMALCIATGRPFHGRKVEKGPVVYVVSEGGRGILKRVLAWVERHGVTEKELGEAFFLLDAVQMREKQDVEAFLQTLEELKIKPLLIVLDTFARSFVGGEENSAKEVGEWIDASREVQLETGATVVAVHHTGKTGNSERGSSSSRGAAEALILVERRGEDGVRITCEKQKDDEAFEPFELRTEKVFVGDDKDGEPVTSLVLVDTGAPQDGDKVTAMPKRLADGPRKALEALRAFPAQEAASAEWRKTVSGSETSFHRWRGQLVKGGLVEKVAEANGRYRVVADSHGLPRDSHDSGPSQTTTTPTTP